MRLAPALTLALAVPLAARASEVGGDVTAVRTRERIVVDGRLEEAVWNRAVPYDGFVQLFPDEGGAPTERTEVRVLYDDRALYVGIVCHDRDPGAIVRALGRRDHAPYSDVVGVVVDSNRDRRTAAWFGVNAAGVQEDALVYDDDQLTADWDAVWDAATASTPDGWSAELMIPFAALRFSNAPVQVWGFAVKRVIARRHEEIASVLVRRNQRGLASRLGALVGLEDLHPARDLEIAPYSAARVAVRPESTSAPRPRLVEPAGDLGLDVKTSLGRGLALQGTMNPDFGQVEADQLIQNLSRFEPFFPEKRPFFLQGMDLFQPALVGSGGRQPPQQLFYSRRIGLDAPILGAAKLTGKASDELQVGLVEAFVDGASQVPGSTERGYRFSPAQPLHFGPAAALPVADPASRNFVAAVGQWQPRATASFGAAFTSALPAGPRCTAADLMAVNPALDDPPPRCEAQLGNAAAGAWNVRTADADWFFRGQASASQWLGGRPDLALADGTVLRRGDLGWGAYASAGRQGGEPWRYEAQWEYESPKLDLNAVGYQRTQNEQVARGILRYVRPGGGGPFHSYAFQLGAEGRATTDGRGLDRGRSAWLSGEFQLRSFRWFGFDVGATAPRWDVREIDQSGRYDPSTGHVPAGLVPFAYGRPGEWYADAWVSLDQGRPVFAEGSVTVGETMRAGPLGPHGSWVAGLTAVARPHPRVETRVDARYGTNHLPARSLDAGGAWFADLTAPQLSITVRQQVVLTPRLTLQAYGQLFATYGRFGAFYAATPAAGRIRPTDLQPAARTTAVNALGSNPDYRDVALNVNVVLRWEYRLGSTLFLVYTRSQTERAVDAAELAPATLRPLALGLGPTTDTMMVKWSYWWNG